MKKKKKNIYLLDYFNKIIQYDNYHTHRASTTLFTSMSMFYHGILVPST